MHYVNAWLKRCVFNLDLNRESVSEPRTLSGRLFQSLGAKNEKSLPPLVDFAILGTTKSPEFPLELSRDITENFSVMGTPSLQPFLKSYWLTPVNDWPIVAKHAIACKY